VPRWNTIWRTLLVVVEFRSEYRLEIPWIRGGYKVPPHQCGTKRPGSSLLILSREPFPYQMESAVFDKTIRGVRPERMSSPMNPFLLASCISRRTLISFDNSQRDPGAVTAPNAIALRLLYQSPYLTPSENLTGQPTTMPHRTRKGLYAKPNREAR